MHIKYLSTISLIAVLASCGGTGGTDTGGTDTGGTKSVNVNGVTYTSDIVSADGNSFTLDNTDSNGHTVIGTSSIAGSSQTVAGYDVDRGQEIVSFTSDLPMSSSPLSIGNVTFDGSFAQQTVNSSGAVVNSSTGTASMQVNAAAGSMTLSGDNGFAVDGEVLYWSVDGFQSASTYSEYFAVAGVYGGTETVGSYVGGNSSVTIGTFGGVAQ